MVGPMEDILFSHPGNLSEDLRTIQRRCHLISPGKGQSLTSLTSLQNRRRNDRQRDLSSFATWSSFQAVERHGLPREQKANDLLTRRRVDMEKLGIEPRTFSTQHVP
jgi:hypothetical protein